MALRRAAQRLLASSGSATANAMQATPDSLHSLMYTERLMHETPEEVQRIWEEYHANSSVHSVHSLSPETYDAMCRTASESSVFLLPVEKNDGFVTMLLEMRLPKVQCTTVHEYKQSAEQASPHVVATYFSELRHSHNLVLARADVLTNWLTVHDVSTLMQRTHSFYTDPRRAEYVRLANRRSDLFDFNDVLHELGISPPSSDQQE
jgi:hypothetical protein